MSEELRPHPQPSTDRESAEPPPTPNAPRPNARQRRARRRHAPTAILSWLYLILILALWAFLRIAADRWWVATLLLFGPLWVFALPLAILLPAALLFRPRSLL